jgi:hypothetical protein
VNDEHGSCIDKLDEEKEKGMRKTYRSARTGRIINISLFALVTVIAVVVRLARAWWIVVGINWARSVWIACVRW